MQTASAGELLEALQPLADEGARRRDDEHALEVPALEAHCTIVLGALERIHAQVGNRRRAQRREGLLPDLQALGM